MYDLHCAQDTLNLRTHADFITLSYEDDEGLQNKFPYWFGQIVRIFHTIVVYIGPGSHFIKLQHMEFLLVQWFGCDLGHQEGWKASQPYWIGFVDGDDNDTFGFLDL
jgi:hypothetical protein